MNIERKLAAIVFTDIAGFTDLSSQDEKKAFSLIEKQREIIKPIVEKFKGCRENLILNKKKYLVPNDLTLGQFTYVIRKRLSIKPEQAIFLYMGTKLGTTGSLMSTIYDKCVDEDGFLYITYTTENTFG